MTITRFSTHEALRVIVGLLIYAGSHGRRRHVETTGHALRRLG